MAKLNDSTIKTIKLSGGEPTLHPQYPVIVRMVRECLPKKKLIMATNGKRLLHYSDVIPLFDCIYFSHYPGLNDYEASAISQLRLPNLDFKVKRDGVEMHNVNSYVPGVYQHTCAYTHIRKVVGDQIYPCCAAHGICEREKFSVNDVSIPFVHGWRAMIDKININKCCQHCFMGQTPFRAFLTKVRNLLS